MKVNDSEIIKFLLEQSDGTADNDDRMMMMKMARWCHWSNEKDSYEIVRKGFDRSDSLLRSAAQPEVLFEVRLFQGNSEIRQGLFWSMTGVAVVVGLMAAAGNLAVLVMASKTSRNSGNPAASLRRHLNQTIRSLALADLLTAALGFPLITLYYYWGKKGWDWRPDRFVSPGGSEAVDDLIRCAIEQISTESSPPSPTGSWSWCGWSPTP